MQPKAIRSILALVLLVGLVLATVPAVFADGPVTGEFSAPRVPQSRAVSSSAPSAITAATVVYVRPGGDDTNCLGTADVDYPGGGGPGLACAVKTINQGIANVIPGGTVYVAAGTYVGDPRDRQGCHPARPQCRHQPQHGHACGGSGDPSRGIRS